MNPQTRWIVLIVFVVLGAALGVAAALTDGPVQDLMLNLLAETAGAAFIVLFVDRLLARSKERDRDERRRAAIVELELSVRELRRWLRRFASMAPSAASASDDELLERFPRYLAEIDLAGPAPTKQDRFVIESERREFDRVVLDFARWERNFAGSAGLFDDAFRAGAERLHVFVRDVGSFLDGMERYIVREQPTGPVFAFDGITELTEDGAARLAGDLRAFLDFYRAECACWGVDADSASRA